MKKMEYIDKTNSIPRYELAKNESFWELMSELGYGDDNGDEGYLLGFFNTNFTGAREFKRNFLNFPEIAYHSVEQIMKQAKELNLPHWTVVSFYRENGWDGVYSRTGNEALTRKCNNWVNFGQDGFYYVVFAKDEEELDRFITALEEYINYGSYVYEIYDNLEEEYLDDNFYTLGADVKKFEEWKEKTKEKYGFEEDDFE